MVNGFAYGYLNRHDERLGMARMAPEIMGELEMPWNYRHYFYGFIWLVVWNHGILYQIGG
jgi:hypothetical protein